MEEELIISKIKNGNQDGLKLLMGEMNRNVYALCYKITGHLANKEDLEELVADTFITVWKKIDDYHPEKGSLKTWVYMIAKYNALTFKRKAEKNKETTEIDDKFHQEGFESVSDLAIDVRQYAEMLSGEDKQLLIRRCFFDENIEKIALDLKSTREALDTRMWRIRKGLKEFFKMEGGGKHERNRKINR